MAQNVHPSEKTNLNYQNHCKERTLEVVIWSPATKIEASRSVLCSQMSHLPTNTQFFKSHFQNEHNDNFNLSLKMKSNIYLFLYSYTIYWFFEFKSGIKSEANILKWQNLVQFFPSNPFLKGNDERTKSTNPYLKNRIIREWAPNWMRG